MGRHIFVLHCLQFLGKKKNQIALPDELFQHGELVTLATPMSRRTPVTPVFAIAAKVLVADQPGVGVGREFPKPAAAAAVAAAAGTAQAQSELPVECLRQPRRFAVAGCARS